MVSHMHGRNKSKNKLMNEVEVEQSSRGRIPRSASQEARFEELEEETKEELLRNAKRGHKHGIDKKSGK